jgi:hypothetical protein
VITRKQFSEQIAKRVGRHIDRAVAFLWFYRRIGPHEERAAGELARDLAEEDFPKPNTTRLNAELANTRYTVRGKRPRSFKISLAYLEELDGLYGDLVEHIEVPSTDSILPNEWFIGRRGYLENLVRQINGCYDVEFYDSCAVMMRRLMETLLIEVYENHKKADAIKENGNFFPLERLIGKAISEKSFHWNRASKKDMGAIKHIGDIAAHDRTYVVHETDITDIKQGYRRLTKELLILAGLAK